MIQYSCVNEKEKYVFGKLRGDSGIIKTSFYTSLISQSSDRLSEYINKINQPKAAVRE